MNQQSLRTDDCTENEIKTYANMVYRLALARTGTKHDADDIFQEVFLRYLKSKPVFETEEHRKAWLIRVTINCSKKFWSAWWRTKITELDETIPFETKEDIDLYKELQQLPVKYRTVIHLFYYEDLTVEKISEILDQNPSTVRAQLTRARHKLKDILKEEYEAYEF